MRDESRLIFVSRDQAKVKEIKISRLKLTVYISIFLVTFVVAGKFGLDFLIDFSHNSRINRLERTNAVLQARLGEMKDKIGKINNTMDQIVKNDDELRIVIGLDEINADIRNVGIGGSNFDYDFGDEISGFDENVELSTQFAELAKLERGVQLELDSYRELMSTFQKKQDSLQFMPSLKPVLHSVISSKFGMRLHPINRVYRHHDGLDFSAPKGTPVYASADGVIRFAGMNGGYGNMVMIDHHYGFETGYGHLNKIVVRSGQKVKRGDKIGEVGNTGISTAPHLHYEVRHNGKHLNPMTYYFDDMILNERVVKKEIN